MAVSISSIGDVERSTVDELEKVRPLCVAFWLKASAAEREQLSGLPRAEKARASSFWDGVASEAATWALASSAWNASLTFEGFLSELEMYQSLLSMPSPASLPFGTADVVNAIRTASLSSLKAEQDTVRNFFMRIPEDALEEVLYHSTEGSFDFDRLDLVSRLVSQARKLGELTREAGALSVEAESAAEPKKSRRGFFRR